MNHLNPKSRVQTMLLRAFFAGSIFFAAVPAIEGQQRKPESAKTPAASGSSEATVSSSALPRRHRKLTSPYRSKGTSIHEKQFYQINWGVDSFAAKTVEAGQLIRFSYRVLDAEKAKALNDKRASPTMIDERAHAQLVVPSMEKVGQLRQSSTPEVGITYWMVFSNKGRVVKRGDRVRVVIGQFHADELVVD